MVNPWSKEKYREIIGHYGLSQRRMAKLMGVTPRSGARWALEDGPPLPVCLVLSMMQEFGLTRRDLIELSARLRQEPHHE